MILNILKKIRDIFLNISLYWQTVCCLGFVLSIIACVRATKQILFRVAWHDLETGVFTFIGLYSKSKDIVEWLFEWTIACFVAIFLSYLWTAFCLLPFKISGKKPQTRQIYVLCVANFVMAFTGITWINDDPQTIGLAFILWLIGLMWAMQKPSTPTHAAQSVPLMDVATQLEKLSDLANRGIISQAEFQEQKRKVLGT